MGVDMCTGSDVRRRVQGGMYELEHWSKQGRVNALGHVWGVYMGMYSDICVDVCIGMHVFMGICVNVCE